MGHKIVWTDIWSLNINQASWDYFNDLLQQRHNSSASVLAMELCLSGTNPSISEQKRYFCGLKLKPHQMYSFSVIMGLLCQIMSAVFINTGSVNGLLLFYAKPLLHPILTYCQLDLYIKHHLNPNKNRTTRTPAFWGYPPPPHDYPHYWVMLDPKSKQGRMTLNI